MKTARRFTFIVLIPFMALSAYTLHDVGVIGLFEHQFAESGGWQVFMDLGIALGLILCWLVPHARRTGRNPWPYVALTLALGSFGPLAYLALAEPEEDEPASS